VARERGGENTGREGAGRGKEGVMGRRGGGDVSAQVIMVEEGVLQMAADQRPGGSLDQDPTGGKKLPQELS
jgi:hypothetical protein